MKGGETKIISLIKVCKYIYTKDIYAFSYFLWNEESYVSL